MAWLESLKSLVFETAPLDTVDLFLDYYDSGNPRPPNTMFISSPPSYVPPGFSSLLSILRDKGHNTIFLCPLGLPFPLNSSPLDEIGDFIWKKFLLAGLSLSSSLNIILLNYVAELATTFFFPHRFRGNGWTCLFGWTWLLGLRCVRGWFWRMGEYFWPRRWKFHQAYLYSGSCRGGN